MSSCSVSKRRLVITAVLAGQSQSEVARTLRGVPGLDQPAHGPLPRRGRSRVRATVAAPADRPRTRPPPATVELIVELRNRLARLGLDAGADTIGWHLRTTTTSSCLAGHDPPDPGPRRARGPATRRSVRSRPTSGSRPSSPTRPGSPTSPTTGSPDPDGTPGADVEIITWLDDHSRYALHVTAHRPDHRPDRADHVPRRRRPARLPGLDPDRQRHGLHHPLRRRPRRRNRARDTNCAGSTSCRRTPARTTPPPAARSNGSNRP